MNDISDKYLKQAKEITESRGAVVLPNGVNELAALLYKAEKQNKQLRVKLGIDPTSTELHLGHTVCLHLLKCFQELGHKPILVIGGFTATVGDPSGRNEARPSLSYEDVKQNSKTYLEQVRKILDLNNIEVVNNHDWLNKLTAVDLVKLAHLVTINQLIGKEAFGNRVQEGQPLYLHEVLYPILQGYDSVMIKADIEIGGIDQTFNVLFGRHIQKHFMQDEQVVILLPLLIGLDGLKKMSKTFNNFISLNDAPNDIFGKTMSIPDELIIHYFSLVTNLSFNEIKKLEASLKSNVNPRDIKMLLADKLVSELYDKQVASKAQEAFVKQFRLNKIPEDVNEYQLNESLKIVDLMYVTKMVLSKTEAKRLIEGGGVKLQSNKIKDPNFMITKDYRNSVLQIGKRKFLRLV
ncbi:MAG: tyrosine--tRNA ligase [Candidatus Melainabacteria bacterium]|nr:tyrosine--tRNA ligase [Candidatus Melainabacteria bacterium]